MMKLTDREWEVLYGASRGETCKETGERLGIATETVKWHRTNLFDKLGVHSRVSAVAVGFEKGLLV